MKLEGMSEKAAWVGAGVLLKATWDFFTKDEEEEDSDEEEEDDDEEEEEDDEVEEDEDEEEEEVEENEGEKALKAEIAICKKSLPTADLKAFNAQLKSLQGFHESLKKESDQENIAKYLALLISSRNTHCGLSDRVEHSPRDMFALGETNLVEAIEKSSAPKHAISLAAGAARTIVTILYKDVKREELQQQA